ncbi:hypothetical protein U9M48_042573, partial [Paspalum notatum var. saurae]
PGKTPRPRWLGTNSRGLTRGGGCSRNVQAVQRSTLHAEVASHARPRHGDGAGVGHQIRPPSATVPQSGGNIDLVSHPSIRCPSPSVRRPSPSLAAFSPIVLAPVRVGEDEPPLSWDPVPSPEVIMFGRGSPKLNLMSKASKRKNSPKVLPKVRHTKDNGSTSSEKTKAAWNPAMEKTLVDLLHNHNTPEYRSQIGWKPKAWNKIVKEFHEKEKYVSFTKSQIQDKEKELKKSLQGSQRSEETKWGFLEQ